MILPNTFSPELESKELLVRAVHFSDNEYSRLHLVIISGNVYVFCANDRGADLYIVDSGGPKQAADNKVLAGPIHFADGKVSGVVGHYMGKMKIRVFYNLDGENFYKDFDAKSGAFEAEAHSFGVSGIPFDMNKTLHAEPIMSVLTDKGAAMCRLNNELTATVDTKIIEGAVSAQFADRDRGGYFAFVDFGGYAKLMESENGSDWTAISEEKTIAGRPTFTRIGRTYYLGEQTEQGYKISISYDCKHFETLHKFGADTKIGDYVIYEWDCILHGAALLDNKPIVSRLR